MKLIIDRIEDDIAVCEMVDDKKMVEIKLDELPENVKEGSILKFKNGRYELDLQTERKRRMEMQEYFNRLRKK